MGYPAKTPQVARVRLVGSDGKARFDSQRLICLALDTVEPSVLEGHSTAARYEQDRGSNGERRSIDELHTRSLAERMTTWTQTK